MPKAKDRRRSIFACTVCGNESPRWMGFCPSPACGSVLPLIETAAPTSIRAAKPSWLSSKNVGIVELSELSGDTLPRDVLPSEELNRVLGGGVVPGSMVLLAGEPGVGKSTLLLQVAQSVAGASRKVLYISGEESPQQIKLRAQRLGFSGEGVLLLPETDLDQIFERLDEAQPTLVIVDSIQTLYCDGEPSGPGSVAQVREAGLRLLRWSKATGIPLFVSGHMTKDGSLAGPRVLEHMVDVVLYLESQEMGTYRVLRASKNRFGSTTEVGIFEMTERGMEDVSDPSHAMMSQRSEDSVGAALVPVLEGSRALLLEVQALTSFSHLPSPRRVANGIDYNRMLMLTAVASRRADLELSGQDIIANVVSGFRVSEPAADLGVILALASSLQNTGLNPGMATFGEVGLSGELRRVPQAQRRLNEAARLGLVQCILPEACIVGLEIPEGMKVTPARTLQQAVTAALGFPRNPAGVSYAE